MNGATFVHDELVKHGWEVLVADAQRVKGLAPLACKTDRIDSRVLAELSFGTSWRRSGCRRRACAESWSARATGCTWSSTAIAAGSARQHDPRARLQHPRTTGCLNARTRTLVYFSFSFTRRGSRSRLLMAFSATEVTRDRATANSW